MCASKRISRHRSAKTNSREMGQTAFSNFPPFQVANAAGRRRRLLLPGCVIEAFDTVIHSHRRYSTQRCGIEWGLVAGEAPFASSRSNDSIGRPPRPRGNWPTFRWPRSDHFIQMRKKHLLFLRDFFYGKLNDRITLSLGSLLFPHNLQARPSERSFKIFNVAYQFIALQNIVSGA
jgi:hypothetical protein